jgi:broad specificity phosphatase PhoE
MTTFLLVRHGATDAVGMWLAGWTPGCHLNSIGKQQVEQLAQLLSRLTIEAIYTSPLERTVETAEAIGRVSGIVPFKESALGEIRIGSWEGRTLAELNGDEQWFAFNKTRSMIRPPGGELMIEVQTRMIQATETLRDKHPEGTIVLVSHGDPIRSLIAHYLGISLDLISRFEIAPASISVIRFPGNVPQVLCLNRVQEFAIENPF